MLQVTVLQLTRLIRAFHNPLSTRALQRARSGKATALKCILLAGMIALGTYGRAEEVQRGPDVVIIAGEDKVVYEFRQNGELRMVRVVPKRGKPYYLVPRDDTRGFGNLERADMLLPQWVIAEF